MALTYTTYLSTLCKHLRHLEGCWFKAAAMWRNRGQVVTCLLLHLFFNGFVVLQTVLTQRTEQCEMIHRSYFQWIMTPAGTGCSVPRACSITINLWLIFHLYGTFPRQPFTPRISKHRSTSVLNTFSHRHPHTLLDSDSRDSLLPERRSFFSFLSWMAELMFWDCGFWK